MKKKVAVVGLGEFGSHFVSWILSGKMNVELLYCVELDRSKHRTDIPCYTSLIDIPGNLLAETSVVVDCAVKGSGESNIGLYRKLGIPAVFQNGEATSLCELFYSPLAVHPVSPYLKIARCSALMSCAIAQPLIRVAKIEKVWACFFKVNSRDCMLDMNYVSGKEITMLTGVPARVDVVYLRGNSHNGYAYHGTIHLECLAPPSRSEILGVFARNPETVVVHQDIDTLSYPRGTRTLVVEEGVEVSGTTIRIAVLSFTPEINFPQNEAAINVLAESGSP